MWVTDRQSVAPGQHIEADDAWDAFLAASPHGHLLQSARWARFKSGPSWSALRVVLRTIPSPTAPLLGGASILFRTLPFRQSLAYVPKGPAVNWSEPDQVRAVLTMARSAAAKAGAALLKIEPDLPLTPALSTALQQHGFLPSPQRVQPLTTIVVDLGGERRRRSWAA